MQVAPQKDPDDNACCLCYVIRAQRTKAKTDNKSSPAPDRELFARVEHFIRDGGRWYYSRRMFEVPDGMGSFFDKWYGTDAQEGLNDDRKSDNASSYEFVYLPEPPRPASQQKQWNVDLLGASGLFDLEEATRGPPA